MIVIHGTADRILPIGATAERPPGLIADAPPEVVNPVLLDFLSTGGAR